MSRCLHKTSDGLDFKPWPLVYTRISTAFTSTVNESQARKISKAMSVHNLFKWD
ncbi:MAG: hypothetical protein ACTSXN_12360 [Promethearchaeota archaeon]